MDLNVIMSAAKSGNWALLAAAVLVACVWAARKFLGGTFPFLKTDAGGVVLAFLGSLGAALVTALAGGGAMSWAVLLAAAKVSWMAMGGYAALRKVVLPLLSKIPWLGKLLPDPAAMKADAEKAGAAAVAAKPAQGVLGIVKKPPTEVP